MLCSLRRPRRPQPIFYPDEVDHENQMQLQELIKMNHQIIMEVVMDLIQLEREIQIEREENYISESMADLSADQMEWLLSDEEVSMDE